MARLNGNVKVRDPAPPGDRLLAASRRAARSGAHLFLPAFFAVLVRILERRQVADRIEQRVVPGFLIVRDLHAVAAGVREVGAIAARPPLHRPCSSIPSAFAISARRLTSEQLEQVKPICADATIGCASLTLR